MNRDGEKYLKLIALPPVSFYRATHSILPFSISPLLFLPYSREISSFEDKHREMAMETLRNPSTPCMNWSWRSTTNLIIVVAARKQASGLDTDAKNAILIFTKPIWLHMMHQILMNSFRVPPLNSLETHQNPAMRNAE